MIEKNQLKKIVKSILRHRDDLPDHQIMHPFREWLLCLSVTAILLAVMVFFCVRLYQHYSNLVPGQNNSTDVKSTGVIYRSEEVALALENFTARKATYDQIKQKLIDTATIVPPTISTTNQATTGSSTPEVISEVATETTSTTSTAATPEAAATEPLPVTEAI